MKIKQFVLNFIPIFLLFALVSYTEKFIHVSGTVLGKLFAVFIVLFYTSISVLHGILATALIILYYQSDVVESMLNMYEYSDINTSITPLKPVSEDITPPTRIEKVSSLSYLSQYERQTPDITISENKKALFRRDHCKKGHLTVKTQNIPIDMTTHIYPEVSYVSDKCNICDSTCDFTVSDTIISTGAKEGFASVSCRH
jgi:hypothetical protein